MQLLQTVVFGPAAYQVITYTNKLNIIIGIYSLVPRPPLLKFYSIAVWIFSIALRGQDTMLSLFRQYSTAIEASADD